jgi:hypothetical protein
VNHQGWQQSSCPLPRQFAGEGQQDGALASCVGTDERHHFPGVNGRVEVADRGPTYAIRLILEVTAQAKPELALPRGGCQQAQGAGGLDRFGPAVRAEFGVQVA